MIKGTVGATAAMWAAPAVTTFGSRAMAASLVPQCSSGATYDCGGPVESCGTSGPNHLCVCDQKVDGGGFCWEDFFCADLLAKTCVSSSECASGWACVTSCCGQTCAPACGTNVTGDAQTNTGPTGVGKK